MWLGRLFHRNPKKLRLGHLVYSGGSYHDLEKPALPLKTCSVQRVGTLHLQNCVIVIKCVRCVFSLWRDQLPFVVVVFQSDIVIFIYIRHVDREISRRLTSHDNLGPRLYNDVLLHVFLRRNVAGHVVFQQPNGALKLKVLRTQFYYPGFQGDVARFYQLLEIFSGALRGNI